MLLHYFITGLKPITLHEPPPMSSDEFLRRAIDCLSGQTLTDLMTLASAVKSHNHGLWRPNLEEISNLCRSSFLKAFAQDATKLYAAIGSLFDESARFFEESYGWKAHLKDPDPMVLETSIARALVRLAEEHSGLETFAESQIFVYFINLLMCERLSSFNEKNGQTIVDDLVASVIVRAHQ